MDADEPILGIDIGTSKVCVAAVDRDGSLRLFANSSGLSLIPAAVCFHRNGNVLVGDAALDQRSADPDNVLSLERWPGGEARITRAGAIRPVDVTAILLDHARRMADGALGSDTRAVALPLPYTGADGQKGLLEKAARRSGLVVAGTLSSPEAIAFAYGLADRPSRIVAVCDFGASKIEASLLRAGDGAVEVLASECDYGLGGSTFSERLVGWMTENVLGLFGVDVSDDRVALRRMRIAAEASKKKLWQTGDLGVGIELPSIVGAANGAACDLSLLLTPTLFADRTSDLVERCVGVCDRALRHADLEPGDVVELVIAGGTCRIPSVKRRLQSYFGRTPRMDVDPETAVALGAALAAAQRKVQNRRITAPYGKVTPPPEFLARPPRIGARTARIGRITTKKRFTAVVPTQLPGLDVEFGETEPTLEEVTAAPLAISTVGGFCDEIIPVDIPIPSQKMRIFTTGRDDQSVVEVSVCQGESRRFLENTPLGTLILAPLPPRSRGKVRIAVTFCIDSDGVLEAAARDEDTGQEQSLRIALPQVAHDS